MKPVRVASEKEFERLLDHLAYDAHRAADHWNLLKGLEAASKRYGVEMYESQAFWGFTTKAHYDVALLRLCRLYDQHAGSLSLKRFLLTVRASVEYFAEDAVRKRLQNNPFVERLLERKLNLATLGADIRRVSADVDSLVLRLCNLRNESIAHVQPNSVRLAAPRPALKGKEIETLLNRALKIVTRYSLTYRASWSSARVIGADDYNHMLDLVRRGRNAVIAEHEEKIRPYLQQSRTR